MYAVTQDVRFALRCLLKAPAFTAPALLTLVLGIGSNTAVLSVANAIILRPLPGIADPGGLAWVAAVDRRAGHRLSLRPEDLREVRASGAFERIAASAALDANLAFGGEVERARVGLVNGEFFGALGVTPAHGRLFVEADATAPDRGAVAVLSFDFWQRRFGGDPGVPGRALVVNGHPFTVVGVAPRGFIGTELADHPPGLWALAVDAPATNANGLMRQHAGIGLEAVGRLRPGVSREHAAAALEVLAGRLRSGDPSVARDVTFQLTPFGGGLTPADRGDALPVALVGFAVAGAVLLIACANVAGLLLARASRREREIGIRIALGATRTRVIRQLMTESALLAVLAGAGGLLVAWWGTGVLTRALDVPLPLQLRPDTVVLAGTLAVSLLAALVFGLVHAFNTLRPDVAGTLVASTVAGPPRRRARLQRGVVVAQVALSVVLLATAGVLLRHLRTAAGIDERTAGVDRLLVASFDLAGQGYSDERQRAFGRDLLDRLERMALIESASLAAVVPLGGARVPVSVLVDDGAVPAGTRRPIAWGNWVWPGYFRTLGTPIVRGRGFTDADESSGEPVAIVNETLARQFWPGQDAIGKRFRSAGKAPVTIVGVVADSRYDAAGDRPGPSAFFPGGRQLGSLLPLGVVVRARQDAAAVLPIVRDVIRQLDPALPVFAARTMGMLLAARHAPQRAASMVLALFGALALLLTAIGVYGVMGCAVERRTREIGVRVALGADARDVLRLLLREGGSLAVAGVTIGVLLALGATTVFASFAGVARVDVNLMAGISAVVVGCIIAACWVPARRALRVDPAVTLRVE